MRNGNGVGEEYNNCGRARKAESRKSKKVAQDLMLSVVVTKSLQKALKRGKEKKLPKDPIEGGAIIV